MRACPNSRVFGVATAAIVALAPLPSLGADSAGGLKSLWPGAANEDRGLEAAAGRAAELAKSADGPVLAASISGEGHWTFRNSAGESFTAVGANEVAHALQALVPGGATEPGRLTLVLAPGALFEGRDHLSEAPKGARLRQQIADADYPLEASPGREPHHVEARIAVRPGVWLVAGEENATREALAELTAGETPLKLRLISLEPGGPETLQRRPTSEGPAAAGPLKTDPLNPYKLAPAIASASGETLVVMLRLDPKFAYLRLPNGTEASLILDDLLAAARTGDANLVILESPSPRQPGTRNWLWQRVDVAGLAKPVAGHALADILSAVAPEGTGLEARPELSDGRLRLRFEPRSTPSMIPSFGLGKAWSELASEIQGNVQVTGALIELTPLARQREVAMRLVPVIPSLAQYAYLGLLALGLLVVPRVRSLWRGVARPERREDYRSRLAFEAARLVKLALFLLLFTPLAALPAALLTLLGRPRRATQAEAASLPGKASSPVRSPPA